MLNPNFVVMAECRELEDFLSLNIGATNDDVKAALLGLYNVLVKNENAVFPNQVSLPTGSGLTLEKNFILALTEFVHLISQEKSPTKGALPKTAEALSRFVDLIVLHRKTSTEPLSVIKSVDRGGLLTYMIRKIPAIDLGAQEKGENIVERHDEDKKLTNIENVIALIGKAGRKLTQI